MAHMANLMIGFVVISVLVVLPLTIYSRRYEEPKKDPFQGHLDAPIDW